LCLDDSHWADEASIATLAYLFERPPFKNQALLLTTARWEEYSPHLEAWIAILQRSPGLRLVSLSRFSADEIKQLSLFVLGHIPPDEVIHKILTETGGNPFIILEALRTFLERGIQPDLLGLATLPVVKSVQDLVGARMELLTPVARDVIEAAAILGTEFDPEALHQVTGQPLLAVGNALEELEKRNLFELDQPSPGSLRYRFIHDIFREALLLMIHPVRGRWLHARVAKVLEAGPETRDKPALLAQHYEQAGETELALSSWIQSGNRAQQLYASHEADGAYSHAETLLNHSQVLDEGQILSLYTAWSELAYEAGDATKTQEINSRLLRFGELRNSPLLVGSALDGLSTACILTGELEQGLALADKSIGYLDRASHPLKLMDAHIHHGMILSQSRRYAEAVASFQKAIENGGEDIDGSALSRRASARNHQAHALLLNGWPRRSQDVAILATEEYSTLNHLRGQITATYNLALARFHCGEVTQALNDSRIGAILAQRLDIEHQAGLYYGLIATIEMSLGNFDHALENAQHCIDLGEQHDLDRLIAIGYHLFGELLTRLQQYPLAAKFYKMAPLSPEEVYLESYPSLGLGYALWNCQPSPASSQILEDALCSAEASQIFPVLAHARMIRLSTSSQTATGRDTRANLTDLYQQADERGMILIKLRATSLLGRQLLSDGHIEEAIRIARSAIEIASQSNLAWLELQLRLLLDSALQPASQGDPSNRGRILYLLARLESGLSREPYKQAFLEYRASLQALLA
jgi:tetratricopeptide (TPR) repeat protein